MSTSFTLSIPLYLYTIEQLVTHNACRTHRILRINVTLSHNAQSVAFTTSVQWHLRKIKLGTILTLQAFLCSIADTCLLQTSLYGSRQLAVYLVKSCRPKKEHYKVCETWLHTVPPTALQFLVVAWNPGEVCNSNWLLGTPDFSLLTA